MPAGRGFVACSCRVHSHSVLNGAETGKPLL